MAVTTSAPTAKHAIPPQAATRRPVGGKPNGSARSLASAQRRKVSACASGGLLELAGWIVLGFVLLGAVAGFLIWRALRSFLDRWS